MSDICTAVLNAACKLNAATIVARIIANVVVTRIIPDAAAAKPYN
jgi:hypothetical protein